MEIKLHEIKVKDIFNGYIDSQENGVVGYGGKLNIRPCFQREFVYKDKQRDEVIRTIMKGFPLNVMYWVENDDGNYELLDGQQRTISICQYLNNDFSIDSRKFGNLTNTEQEQILNYPLMIYICKGNDREKLDWFLTINIAGVQLRDQEIRNAMYTGEWLTDAKKYFSQRNCPAYMVGKDFINGEANRQDYLEITLQWIGEIENKKIEDYMSEHQHDRHATPLWQYYQSVITWIKTLFPTYRKEMKGLPWGSLYNTYKDKNFNPQELEEKVSKLMRDSEVQKKSGIYEYLLTGKEKYLNLRAFDENDKREKFEEQGGTCPMCISERREKYRYKIEEMEADHIKPWCEGGKTTLSNCQMLCKEHNRLKSNN